MFQHDHNVADDKLYPKIVAETKTRSKLSKFHVSQAVFTPDEAAIGTNSLFLFRPSLFQWTERQYTEDGPFDKWLRDVKTCRTRTKCCGPSGFSNIIIRDFPSRAYASNVVAKNYKSSSTASGSEGQCERNAVAEIGRAHV